jgi:flagellar assembly protein FliH
MSDSRLIAATDATQLWAPPSVHGPAAKPRERIAASDLSRRERATLEEHYARAKVDGTAAGRAEFEARTLDLHARIARLDSMLNLLAKPLADLDTQVEKQLVTLALTVAKHLVRRELRIDPTQVVAIIRETVALLPAAARDVRVHLHPEDAALVRERLAQPQAERAWTVIEDPVMGRGGCRVTTDTALIDARLETRLGAVISQVLGSERADSRHSQSQGISQDTDDGNGEGNA